MQEDHNNEEGWIKDLEWNSIDEFGLMLILVFIGVLFSSFTIVGVLIWLGYIV